MSAPTVHRSWFAALWARPVVREALRFLLVGTTGTGLQLLTYALAREPMGATAAGVLSWIVGTLSTNLAHRAFTFGIRTKERLTSDNVIALMTALVGLGLTTTVANLTAASPMVVALVALAVANFAVGTGRFFFLRWWLRR